MFYINTIKKRTHANGKSLNTKCSLKIHQQDIDGNQEKPGDEQEKMNIVNTVISNICL